MSFTMAFQKYWLFKVNHAHDAPRQTTLIDKQTTSYIVSIHSLKNVLALFHIINTFHLNRIQPTATKIQAFQQHMNRFDTLKKPIFKTCFYSIQA